MLTSHSSELESLHNFRDLGGTLTKSRRAVRRGLLFRCGGVHLWSPDEAAAVRSHIHPKTLIDLRHSAEGDVFPVPVDDIGANYVRIPFSRKMTDDEIPPVLPALSDSYQALIRMSSDSILELLETVADPANLPAVLFCAAGKDRTGVATALILGSLNVSSDAIIADYALTGVVPPEKLGPGYAEHMGELPEHYFASEPETMRTVLDAIKAEHGSIRTFVARLGFDAGKLLGLERALLTEELS